MHSVDLAREIQHGIHHMHAAPGHAAAGAFCAILPPVIFAYAIDAGAVEIAFHVQQLAQASVAQRALHFHQRGLEAPVVADGERDVCIDARLQRRFGAGSGQREWFFGKHRLARFGASDDLLGVCGVRCGENNRFHFRIGQCFVETVHQRKSFCAGVLTRVFRVA